MGTKKSKIQVKGKLVAEQQLSDTELDDVSGGIGGSGATLATKNTVTPSTQGGPLSDDIKPRK